MTGKHAGNPVYKTHKRVGRGSATTLDSCFPPAKTTPPGGSQARAFGEHEEPPAAGHAPGPCAPGGGLEHQVCGGLPRALRQRRVQKQPALQEDSAGRLRLLPGVRRGAGRDLLPHRVGHGRRQVRPGAQVSVFQ